MCLKCNGSSVRNNLFIFQTTNYIVASSKLSSLRLMHFPILFWHASMHSWKDSSTKPFSSVVTVLLVVSTPSKRVPLMIPLSFWKRKKFTLSKIWWIGRVFQFANVLGTYRTLHSYNLIWAVCHLFPQRWWTLNVQSRETIGQEDHSICLQLRRRAKIQVLRLEPLIRRFFL